MKKSIRCIAVDDNELDRITIKSYLGKSPDMELVGLFENPLIALEQVGELNPDVLFLDIDMPGMSGLEFRRKVAEIPICVFTTDHPEFALESYELETLDYLLKPYTFERFTQTIEKIKEYFSIRQKADKLEMFNMENALFIKSGHKKVKVFINDILYLEALQNYTILVTETEKHHVLMTLGNMLDSKEFSHFIRVHKSFAVQKEYIKIVETKSILLHNGVSVPIGRSYKENLDSLL